MTTTKTVSRIRVTDAAREVREAKRALARPSAWYMTEEKAQRALADAWERLARARAACPDHTAPVDTGR